MRAIIKDESGWADFFITRIGLMLFAAVLLLSSFKIYPMFQERETGGYLDAVASDIASKIEAVDTTTIPGYRYAYSFDEKDKDIKISISTEYVVARVNMSSRMRDGREVIHAEPMITHVYPPNSNWSNTSGLREYLSRETGKSGDASSPLNFSRDKVKVDNILNYTRSELAQHPFVPDLNKPLFIEKVIIYYNNSKKETAERDYVLVYQ